MSGSEQRPDAAALARWRAAQEKVQGATAMLLQALAEERFAHADYLEATIAAEPRK